MLARVTSVTQSEAEAREAAENFVLDAPAPLPSDNYDWDEPDDIDPNLRAIHYVDRATLVKRRIP